MMMSEFIERTGFEPMDEEYRDIEAEYYGYPGDKDEFCKYWKKQGGIHRLMRIRASRIRELEQSVASGDRVIDSLNNRIEEQANIITGLHKQNRDYVRRIEAIRGYLEGGNV